MKKTDLKVGEEYAVGDDPLGQYPRWNCVRVKLIEVDGVLKRANGSEERGILVRAVTKGRAGYTQSFDVGQEGILESARQIRMLWPEYAEKLAAKVASDKAREAERERRRTVMAATVVRLRDFGIDAEMGRGDGFRFGGSPQTWTVTVDALAALLEKAEVRP